MRKIRELGSLPSDAFEKYQNLGLKQVHRFPLSVIFMVPNLLIVCALCWEAFILLHIHCLWLTLLQLPCFKSFGLDEALQSIEQNKLCVNVIQPELVGQPARTNGCLCSCAGDEQCYLLNQRFVQLWTDGCVFCSLLRRKATSPGLAYRNKWICVRSCSRDTPGY